MIVLLDRTVDVGSQRFARGDEVDLKKYPELKSVLKRLGLLDKLAVQTSDRMVRMGWGNYRTK